MLRRIFFSAGGEVQIRLRGCAGLYGYSLILCDVGTSLMLRRIFFFWGGGGGGGGGRQRSPYQFARVAQAHMGIRGSHVT